MEYQRVQAFDDSSALQDNIETYRRALIDNLKLPNTVADLILSLIFGMLLQHIFDPEHDVASQLDLGLQILLSTLGVAR